MKYLLDTNICIYLIKQKPVNVLKKFQTIEAGEICVSSVTVAEMLYGVEKSKYKKQNRAAIEQFLLPLIVLDFDISAAVEFGKIRNHLESKGMPIGPYDLMIASQAMSRTLNLVTNNTREFSRIPNLTIENWVSE